MKSVLAAVCCLSMCSIPALAQKAMSSQDFVNFAAQTDMVEANLGQLAQDVASDQAVKDYANMLVTDHTNDFNQLTGIAGQANLKMPTAIDAEHVKSAIAPFHKLKGAAFDKKYVAEMIAGHTKAIEIYTKEANDSTDTAIKNYAQETLPVLQKHLSGAKDLEKNKAGTK